MQARAFSGPFQPAPAGKFPPVRAGSRIVNDSIMWYNNRRAVIIPHYGQGDTRAQPAAALMANYTMPLRGH
ncbi:hypothetical protein D3Z39_13945, partial [Anaerotruncus colihominis]|nr:hypothetical protein [Anaerotruncus colihominis]